MVGGGIIKIVKELEKEVVDFVEEEIQEFENSDGKKSKYSEKFQGDVLGKHDPYGEDTGDHEAHASESSIPDPDHDSEWFPAVSGVKSGKSAARQTAAKASSTPEATPKKQVTAGETGAMNDAVQQTLLASAAMRKRTPENSKSQIKRGSEQQSDERGNNGSPHSSTMEAAGGSASQKPNARHESKTNLSSDVSSLSGEKDENAQFTKKGKSAGGTSEPTGNTSPPFAKAPLKQTDGGGEATVGISSSEDPSGEDLLEAGDPSELSSDSPQAIERETFRRKAPIVVADLRELSRKGKKAKEKKEILRGIRRTLEKPHRLYKDPRRLIAARSGDSQRLLLSLKRHGRSIELVDDSDPKDISASPEKLAAVRSNHRLAIRHMIDMGQQYGKDPFDGIDPVDVQTVIEHHAAQHPYRKHKAPYHPREREDNESDFLNDNEESYGDIDDQEGAASDDEEDVANDIDSETADSKEPNYPRLEEAQYFGLDDNRFTRKRRIKKKKRRYPTPYRNDEDPNDLQLAADSLAEVAADKGDLETSEDALMHKRRTHAARKMLKCINRVRSFQQDPEACEGAFVDEAAEEEAEVAGLSPDEIEERYYTLKQVAAHYEERKKKKHNHLPKPHHDIEPRGRHHHPKPHHDIEPRGRHHHPKPHHDIEPRGRHHHLKPHHSHHHKRQYLQYGDAGEGVSEEDIYNSESADIEMSLPQNQFPDVTVYPQGNANARVDDYQSMSDGNGQQDEDDSDILDQLGGALSSIFGEDEEESGEVASDVKGAMEGAEEAATEAETAVEGVEGAVQGAEQAVEGVEGAVGEAEQAAEGVEKAVGEISEVEGELSQVETMGAEAETAAEDIEGAENAEGSFAKMLNLCSNPIDNLTKGDNLLSGVGNLAQNPDDIINQAESLIGAGQNIVGGMANGSSSDDILGSIMGVVGQFEGGEGDESMQDGSSDDGSSGEDDLLGGVMGIVGQFTGEGGNSDPSAEDSEIDATQASTMDNSRVEEENPQEFANANLYGDGYNQ